MSEMRGSLHIYAGACDDSPPCVEVNIENRVNSLETEPSPEGTKIPGGVDMESRPQMMR